MMTTVKEVRKSDISADEQPRDSELPKRLRLVHPWGKARADLTRVWHGVDDRVRDYALRQMNAKQLHARYALRPTDRAVVSAAVVADWAMVPATIVYVPYLIGFYAREACKHLVGRARHGDELARLRALATLRAAAVIGVIAAALLALAGLDPLRSDLFLLGLYGTSVFAITGLGLVACFVVKHRDEIEWVTSRPPTRPTMRPGHSPRSPFRNLRPFVPENESLSGVREASSREHSPKPVVLGRFKASPLEIETSIEGGAIKPRLHHAWLPTVGALLTQTPEDFLKHTLIQGATRTGKTTKFIIPILHYLRYLSDEHGIGGLVFDFKSGVDPVTGERGSLDLDRHCDRVFALDLGEKSAVFNPLRVGGQAFSESLIGDIDPRDPAAHWYRRQITYTSMLVDVMLAVEAFLAKTSDAKMREHVRTFLKEERGVNDANARVIERWTKHNNGVRHATVSLLVQLLQGTPSGEEAAKSINRILSLKGNGKYVVEASKEDRSGWYDYFRYSIGSPGQGGKFTPVRPDIRWKFFDALSGMCDRVTQLAKTYGELLDDSDPGREVIDLVDCVENGQVIGFRLGAGRGGEPLRQLGKTIIKLYTELVLRQVHDGLRTMILLDEAPVLLKNEPDFADYLSKSAQMGGAAVLAYQTRGQWFRNEEMLKSLEDNCGNAYYVLPFREEEARYLSQLFNTEFVETTEKAQGHAPVDGRDRDHPKRGKPRYKDTGYTAHRHEHEHTIFPAAYLAQMQHEAIATCYQHGRRLVAQLLDVEINSVRQAALEQENQGRDVFVRRERA